MSRIGKQPIAIPEKTEVKVSGTTISVKGPLGELTRTFKPSIAVTVADKKVTFEPRRNDLETKALWGTYASHVANMIDGVNKLYEKKLIIEGIGYKADVKGDKIVFGLGFSHPVEMIIPKGIKVVSDKTGITISGIDKEVVGQFTANIRAQKKPEPYKGKGIRYADEVIRRKQGKKTV
jgi:large subunit ribosomal protein L6